MTGFLSSLEELVARGDFVVPPYPAAALRLRRLIDSGSFGLAEVADAAAADPALAAALLRIANSPLYRGSGVAITTLGRAVHRLGARTVSTLALAAGVGAAACADGPLIDVKYRAWRRSLSCALAAQWLARCRSLDPDEAFLAGVLYGFGRSVAIGCVERLLTQTPSAERRSIAEWLEAVEPHRRLLTQRVAEAWQLPTEIRQALGADTSTEAPIAALVSLANDLAAALDRGESGEQLAALRGLSPAEKRLIVADFTNSLPASLDALLEQAGPSKRPRPASAVSKPASAFAGSLHPCSVEVQDLKNRRSPQLLRGTFVAEDGLVLDTERPLQEGSVARLSFAVAGKAIEGWFSVALCLAERGRFRIEVQSFAATREVKEALHELWSSGAPLPPQ